MEKLTVSEKCLLNLLTEKQIGINFDTLYFNYKARTTALENLKNDVNELIDELKRRL